MIKLLKPILFEIPKNVMLGNLFYPVNVADVFNPSVYFVKSFKGLTIGKLTEVYYMGTIPPNEEDTHLYFGTQNHINNCVNNAETVNLKLKSILEKLINDQDTLKSLVSLDFMKRKDLLSETLKTFEPLKLIPRFDTSKKRKQIISPFDDFILERNIYTHGALHLLLPERKLLIEYVKGGKITYCEVNMEILLAYNRTYRIILTFLNLIENLTGIIDEQRVESILKQYNSLCTP